MQRRWNGRGTESGRKESGKKRGNGSDEIVDGVTRGDEERVGTLSDDEEPTIDERLASSFPVILRGSTPNQTGIDLARMGQHPGIWERSGFAATWKFGFISRF